MRYAIIVATSLVMLCLPSTAFAAKVKAYHPALTAVHHWAFGTISTEQQAGLAAHTYYWVPDRHSSGIGFRWHMAEVWYQRYEAAVARARATAAAAVSSGYASGFPLACVAQWESGDQNSWAGYFGFTSPPYDYAGGSGYTSWYQIPYSWQAHMAILEYQTYGGRAWGANTRAHCGI